jgi:hypothetical protein
MRRLSDRARLEGMLALRKALEGVRRGQIAARTASDGIGRAALRERRIEDSSWSRRSQFDLDSVDLDSFDLDSVEHDIDLVGNGDRHIAPFVAGDPELTKALDRIADSIERVSAQLDSYHLERAEHLDAIEFLLREMVISSVPVSGSRSIVLGGVVEPTDGTDDDDIAILPDGFPLAVDTAVEVRSRFHDRWIAGFNIAEAVDTPGRCRYRLTRKSDGIPLPILFDACDVRAVSTSYDRKTAPSARASFSEARPRS